jgi:hypothetical protein
MVLPGNFSPKLTMCLDLYIVSYSFKTEGAVPAVPLDYFISRAKVLFIISDELNFGQDIWKYE